MLATLRTAGTLEDTHIVFTSDHGVAYKNFFYDSMVHVRLTREHPGPGPPLLSRL